MYYLDATTQHTTLLYSNMYICIYIYYMYIYYTQIFYINMYLEYIQAVSKFYV